MLDAEKIVKRATELETKNQEWRQYHQDLALFCLPRKAWQTTIRNVGERLQLNTIFDSTAIRSLKIMSAGFHSNLTNPSSKWFALQTRRLTLMESHDVRMWFKDVEDIMYAVLSSTNFDTTMQEFYNDSGCFGTGIILILEDPKDKVRFTICPANQIVMEEDAQGRVNRIYRNYPMTAQQAFESWGNKCGEVILEKMKEKPQDIVNIVHYVGPRENRDVSKEDNLNMPFISVWIEKSEKHAIKEEGFFEFPYAVGRFYKDPIDVLGFSPAMDVLADIKLVNAQVRTMLRAAMKTADPPLVLPSQGYVLPLNYNAAATNYRDVGTNKDDIQPLPVMGNIPITMEVIRSVQDNIEKGFFVPLFRALSEVTKQMTVPEVQRRIAENMILLGPVVGRFTDELLDPILFRVFNILYRNGDLPDVPEELQNEEMDIVYISPLAKAQRESEIYSIESFLSDVNAIAAVKPDALDKINSDKTIDIIAKIKGVSPDILNSDSDVKLIRDQRAQAQAAANQMVMLQQGADVLNTGAAANKSLADASQVGKK
jgi:hypothetical protein